MNDEKDGGSAFPVPGLVNLPNDQFIYPFHGMTLRDYFASAALQGLIALKVGIEGNSPGPGASDKAREIAADTAYALADAMLEARKPQPASQEKKQ